jgi:hypothetical protein
MNSFTDVVSGNLAKALEEADKLLRSPRTRVEIITLNRQMKTVTSELGKKNGFRTQNWPSCAHASSASRPASPSARPAWRRSRPRAAPRRAKRRRLRSHARGATRTCPRMPSFVRSVDSRLGAPAPPRFPSGRIAPTAAGSFARKPNSAPAAAARPRFSRER